MRAADTARIFIAGNEIVPQTDAQFRFLFVSIGFNLLFLISIIVNLEPEEIKRND